MQERPRAALDTGVLFAHRHGVSHHVEALNILRKKLGFEFTVCPSVLREVAAAETESQDPNLQKLAQLVRQDIDDSDYDCRPFTDTQRKVTELHVDRIVEKKILPGGNRQDARVLIEAAYMDNRVLITTREPILSAASDALELALIECGMLSLGVLSSKEIVDYFAANPV